MGASTVTGRGQGSAEKLGLKGPSNGRNMFVPQLCPHVVVAGEVVTDDHGDVAVNFPEGPLPRSEVYYVVQLTPVVKGGRTIPTDWYVTKTDVDGRFDHFDLVSVSTGAARFQYSVITTGFGLDITDDNPNTP